MALNFPGYTRLTVCVADNLSVTGLVTLAVFLYFEDFPDRTC